MTSLTSNIKNNYANELQAMGYWGAAAIWFSYLVLKGLLLEPTISEWGILEVCLVWTGSLFFIVLAAQSFRSGRRPDVIIMKKIAREKMAFSADIFIVLWAGRELFKIQFLSMPEIFKVGSFGMAYFLGSIAFFSRTMGMFLFGLRFKSEDKKLAFSAGVSMPYAFVLLRLPVFVCFAGLVYLAFRRVSVYFKHKEFGEEAAPYFRAQKLDSRYYQFPIFEFTPYELRIRRTISYFGILVVVFLPMFAQELEDKLYLLFAGIIALPFFFEATIWVLGGDSDPKNALRQKQKSKVMSKNLLKSERP